MSTKVHDDDETFDEVDVILENAKAGLQLKRTLERKSRRTINLSDIPENFAHVPASSKKSELNSSRSPRVETPPPQPVLGGRVNRYKAQQRSSVQATLRWFRDRFTVCISAVDGTCDMCGRSVVTCSVHVPSRRVRHRS